MAEAERPFEVVDRRSGHGGGPSPAATAAAEAGPATTAGPTTAETAQPAEEQAGPGPIGMPTDVRAILAMTVSMLAEAAWVKMGLHLDPGTGKIERDLGQARLAIDCLGDLIQRLGALEDESTRRALQQELTNLRLNFVRQQGAG